MVQVSWTYRNKKGEGLLYPSPFESNFLAEVINHEDKFSLGQL